MRCTGCGLDKVASEFHRGSGPRCAACKSEATRAWRKANASRSRASSRRWQSENTASAAAIGRRKAAARRAAGVPSPGSVQWAADRLVALERDDGVCGICGEDVDPLDFTLDHVVPIALGGPHEFGNLQLAHRVCNSRKARRPAPAPVAA
jgi:5-methylcytosine-specific restriction endonuclease McrA